MARQYEDVEGVAKRFKLTHHQVYKLMRRRPDPLPHRKVGKRLRFDVEKVDKWFDRQTRTDGEDLNIEY